jgi:hypothetical protein
MKTYEYTPEAYLKELVPVARESAAYFIKGLSFIPTYVILGEDTGYLGDNYDAMMDWCFDSLQYGFACHFHHDWIFESEAEAMLFKLAWL